MAILLDSLLGNLSGRVGNMVFYNYRGKTCARRRCWKQNSPGSVAQLQQRNRMRAACIFYRALVAAGLKEAWNKAAEGSLLSGYNLFVRLNIQVISGQGLITDFSRIRLVSGGLPLSDMMEVKRLSPTTVGVRWQLKACCSRNRLSDRLALAFMKSEGIYTVRMVDTGGVCHSACEARIEVPEELAAYPHCYCFFRSARTAETSESRYFYLNV